MKTAVLLFVAALVFFFGVPASLASLEYDEYLDKGASSKLVKENMRRYTDVVIPAGPVIEQELNIGYFWRLYVTSGIKLVHDESLGSKVVARGPKNVLDRIEPFRFPSPNISLHFNRPIKLNEAVEIHLNLNDHTVGKLELVFPCSGKDEWVNFESKSPIRGQQLTLTGGLRLSGDLAVEVDELRLSTRNDRGCQQAMEVRLTGRANTVKLPERGDNFIFSDLRIGAVYREFTNMRGRRLEMPGATKIRMIYNSPNTLDQDGELAAFQPDTLIVNPGTELDIKYREGNELKVLETVVILNK